MNRALVVLITTFVILQFHKNFVATEVAEKSCRTTVQDLTKLQLSLMGQCAKTMKFKNGKEKSKKQNCILRCAMVKAELVNAQGQVTLESVDYLLHKFIPPSLMDRANATFFPCMEIGIKDPFKSVEEDPFCSCYDPFIKCFLQKASTFCA